MNQNFQTPDEYLTLFAKQEARKNVVSDIIQFTSAKESLLSELQAVQKELSDLAKSEGFENLSKKMELLTKEKNILEAVKETKAKLRTLNELSVQLTKEEAELRNSFDQKEKEENFNEYLHMENGICNLLFDCTESVILKDCDAKASYQSPKHFSPLDEINSSEKLKQLLSYIEKNYSNVVSPDEYKGVGYYISIASFPLLHPFFVYAVFYLLIKSGADIYFSDTASDSYDTIYNLAISIVEKYPKAHCTEEDVSTLIKDGANIKHVIDMGDFCNLHCRTDEYILPGIALHYPSAVTILLDYSSEEIPDNDAEKLEILGDKCFDALIDYDAYRGANNKADECYFGFDYGDLFWGAAAVVNFAKTLKIKHDKTVIYVFTDKSFEELDLPSDTNEHCKLIYSKDLDVNLPQYDFRQLFN